MNNENNSQSMNNQNFNQQPVNNQYQNYNNNFVQTTNKKNNKMLFIIIGVVILIIIAIVVLILVLNGNNSKGNTINEYENVAVTEGDNNNNTNNNNNTSTDEEDTISFKGFSIPKKIGYEYEVDTSGLLIGNNSFATMVSVTYGTLDNFKEIKDDLVEQYTSLGYTATNVKVSNYGNKEALTMEISMGVEGQKALFYAIDAENDYSFLGLTMNPSYTIDYNNVQTSVSLLLNAKYTGVYRVPTTDINVIEFKDLFEQEEGL